MKRYRCVANGREVFTDAWSPKEAAKKATTAAGIETGEVEVEVLEKHWKRFTVLGRRYVLPMGRVG